MAKTLRVATRGSKMALIQAESVVAALSSTEPKTASEVVKVVTTGDRKQGTALASNSDKRDWIHDLELSVVEGENDLAVHCGKDVPAVINKDTILVPIFGRGSPWDIFIGKFDKNLGRRILFSEVPHRGIIGTASLRRQAQLLMLRSDISVTEHRGNATTRIEKLDQSEKLSGIVLAAAGVNRLGYEDITRDPFPFPAFVPAVNQGILVAQIKREREDLVSVLSKLQDKATIVEFEAERACVEHLNGDCNSAIGIFAKTENNKVSLFARVLLPDGSRLVEYTASSDWNDAAKLGKHVAEKLLSDGAAELLRASCEIISARKAC